MQLGDGNLTRVAEVLIDAELESERVEQLARLLAACSGADAPSERPGIFSRLGDLMGLVDPRPERLATAITRFRHELAYFASSTYHTGPWIAEAWHLVDCATQASTQ